MSKICSICGSVNSEEFLKCNVCGSNLEDVYNEIEKEDVQKKEEHSSVKKVITKNKKNVSRTIDNTKKETVKEINEKDETIEYKVKSEKSSPDIIEVVNSISDEDFLKLLDYLEKNGFVEKIKVKNNSTLVVNIEKPQNNPHYNNYSNQQFFSSQNMENYPPNNYNYPNFVQHNQQIQFPPNEYTQNLNYEANPSTQQEINKISIENNVNKPAKKDHSVVIMLIVIIFIIAGIVGLIFGLGLNEKIIKLLTTQQTPEEIVISENVIDNTTTEYTPVENFYVAPEDKK